MIKEIFRKMKFLKKKTLKSKLVFKHQKEWAEQLEDTIEKAYKSIVFSLACGLIFAMPLAFLYV